MYAGGLSHTLTCVFDGQMGDQELFFRSRVFTKVTFERTVVSMGQLMVEQQLFVFTSVFAEFTLEPGAYEKKYNQNTKYLRIKVQNAEKKNCSVLTCCLPDSGCGSVGAF